MRKIYLDSITEYLANLIIPNEKKTAENVEIISYGICSILTSSLNLLLSWVTTSILGYQFYYFYFLIFFIPMRCLHKGFHCKTLLQCLILTNILFTISTFCCFVFFKGYDSSLLFGCVLLIHYYTSKEQRTIFHIVYLCVYIIILNINYNYGIFLLVAVVLDNLLIIGGKIDEKNNAK